MIDRIKNEGLSHREPKLKMNGARANLGDLDSGWCCSGGLGGAMKVNGNRWVQFWYVRCEDVVPDTFWICGHTHWTSGGAAKCLKHHLKKRPNAEIVASIKEICYYRIRVEGINFDGIWDDENRVVP